MKTSSRKIALILLTAASAFLTQRTHAASGTWTQLTTGGLWSNSGNWSGGIVADLSSFTANFSTLDITAANTVHMDASHTLTALTFADTTTPFVAWTLDNNGVPGNILTLAGTTPSITVGASSTATISAVLAGTTAWTMAGTGTLVLSGANTYDAATTVSGVGGSFANLSVNTLGNVGGSSSALGAPTTSANGTINLAVSSKLTYTGGSTASDRILNLTGSGPILFNNGGGLLTLSGGITSVNQGITIRGTSGNTTETGVVALGTGTLNRTENGTLTLKNAANSFSGVVTIFAGTISVDSISNGGTQSALGQGTLINLGQAGAFFGTLQFNGPSGGSCNRAFNLTGTAPSGGGIIENTVAGQTLTLSGIVTNAAATTPVLQLNGAGNGVMSGIIGNAVGGVLSLTKTGSGTWSLNGSAVNAYTGTTAVNGGILQEDFSNLATPTDLINNTSPLALGGGTLSVQGKNSVASAQTLGAVTLNAGGSGLAVAGGTSSTLNLTLGNTWTHNLGSAVNITLGTGGTLTSSPAVDVSTPTPLVIGSGNIACATVGGTDWAKVSGGTVVGFASGDYTTGLPVSGATSTVNYSQTGSASVTASETVNTLKLSTSTTGQSLPITSGQTLTLGAGGLLFVGANDYSLTGGTLIGSGGTQKELVVHQYGSGTLTIGSAIANNSTATALTKAGPGTLILSAATESYTGILTVGGGTLQLNGTVAGSAVTMVNAGATLLVNGSLGTGAVTVNAGGTLGGSGISAGAITMFPGGFLQPTLSGTPGTFTCSAGSTPVFNSFCTLKIRVPTSATADKVSLSNTGPTFGCINLNLVIDANGLTGGTFTTPAIVQVAKTSGGIIGPFNSVTVINNTWGYTPTVNYNAQTITVTMTAAPTTTTSGTLAAVNTTYGTASATPTSFTVSGNALTGNLTVAPPAGYEVSTSLGSGYTTSLTLTPTSGTLASTTVYARLAATTTNGTYSGNIQISGGGITPVNVATVASTVSALPITVTANSGQSKVYGASNPTLTYSVSPALVGSDSFSGALSRAAGENVGSSYAIAQNTLSAGANYSLTFNSANFAITARPITVTAQPNTKVYDGNTSATNVPTLTAGTLASGEGFATISEVYADATVGTGKTLIPSATITNSASVDVTANYAITLVNDTSGVISSACTSPAIIGGIDPSSLTVTVGSPVVLALTNVSGTAPFAYQWRSNNVNIASATNSSYTNLSVTVADAGNYQVVVTNDCGSITSSVAVLTVDKQTPLVSTTASATAIVYGQTLALSTPSGAFTNAAGTAVTGSFAFEDPTITPNAGSTNVAVIFTPGDGINYNNVTNTVSVTVAPAVLTITANATNKVYDGVAFSGGNGVTYSSFVNGETNTVLLGTLIYSGTSQGATNVGSYPITPSGLTGANYAITFNDGTLTISKASYFVGASSTINPSGYRDTVSYTATLPADATGNVVFSSSGGYFSTNTVTGSSTGSLSITNLPRGTNLITLVYSGDGNYFGSTNTLEQIVTNHPPVAVDATYYRAKGISLKIALTNLLTNVSDVDGDTNTLQSVGAGTNSATILTDSNYVYYLPGTGAGSNDNDVVSYTVSDGFGGTATANILVNVYSAAGPAQMSLPTNGVVNIKFFGIPNYTYVVQTTTNLAVPWWPLSTNTASTNGFWLFTDPNATNAQQYYRSAQP